MLSVRSWKSVAIIEASLEELPVRAELGQSCLATKISAPAPVFRVVSPQTGLVRRPTGTPVEPPDRKENRPL